MPAKRVLLISISVAVGLGLAIQLVPYGWRHDNPPVIADAPWPDEASEALARDACYSCHSNETDWPAYSYVAPMSWLVRRDVEQGRAALNFSDWPEGADDIDDAVDQLADDTMPPRQYRLAHPEARLDRQERRKLMDAISAMEPAQEAGEDHDGD